VDSRLEHHLQNNNLHEISQSAYKKHHSTETALIKVQSDILESLDKGNVSALVLLDLSAAFDTIDHKTLLHRLGRLFGMDVKALAWVASYLCDRYKTVTINGELSNSVLLAFGVRQGSVLGPKLYVMYTKPLGGIVRHHGLGDHFYADDTQGYLAFKPTDIMAQHDALTRIERCLTDTETWTTQNILYSTRDCTNQWSSFRTGVMWAYRDVRVINRSAVF
jgi:hypothetical protein